MKKLYGIVLLAGFILTSLSACAVTSGSVEGTNNADNSWPYTRWTIEEKGDKLITNIRSDISFTVNRPVREVWPVFKDFNLWLQDLKYTDADGNEVVQGDSEGETIYFSIRPNDITKKYWPDSWGDFTKFRKGIRVLKVIPERLLITDAIHDETHIGAYYIFTLHEDRGKTQIVLSGIYSPFESPKDDRDKINTSNEVLQLNDDSRWNEVYIPTLKRLVEGRK